MKRGLSTASFLSTVGFAVAGIVAGCSSGSPSAPEERNAVWEFLTYSAPETQGTTLRVEGDGSLSIEGSLAGGRPALGLLSPSMWSRLLESADATTFQPIETKAESTLPGVAFVRVMFDSRLWGFAWAGDTQLDPAQVELVTRLREVWANVNSPIDPRVAVIPVEPLLCGLSAAPLERREAVVRDGDTLLRLLAETLPGQTVVMRKVDFEREMIVALFLGAQRPNSGLEFLGVASWSVAGDLFVPVNVVETAGPCERSTGPFCMVTLPRNETSVFFLRNRTLGSCE